MFVKLHRIQKNRDRYHLSEIVVNISHVSYLSENRQFKNDLLEGQMTLGLDKTALFTDVVINKNGSTETITVIGDVGLIESKINKSNKILLRD